MTNKTSLSATEARKNFFKILDEVNLGKLYTITEQGIPKAVVMSIEEFESWLETLDITIEMPEIAADIDQIRKDLRSDSYKRYATLDKVLAQEGYVNDKADNVSYSPTSKSTKRAQ